MKKIISCLSMAALVMVAALALSLTSCEDDDKIIPGESCATELVVLVENENGGNLLDPATPGNLIGTLEATVSYNSEVYQINWWETDPRYEDVDCVYHPANLGGCFMGLWYESHGPIPTTHFLLFGKFSAYDAWKKKLVLEFPKYGLKYDIEWENKKNHSSANIKVNGKKIKGEQITVVLPAEK